MTLERVQATLELSTASGAESRIKDAMASHGIRDSLSHEGVLATVEKGKEMRGRGRSKGKGRQLGEPEVIKWLEDYRANQAPEINPLLAMPGALLPYNTIFISL